MPRNLLLVPRVASEALILPPPQVRPDFFSLREKSALEGDHTSNNQDSDQRLDPGIPQLVCYPGKKDHRQRDQDQEETECFPHNLKDKKIYYSLISCRFSSIRLIDSIRVASGVMVLNTPQKRGSNSKGWSASTCVGLTRSAALI